MAEPSQELLETLEEEELLVRDPDRPGTWRFRHDLLRVVGYESLPKRERRRLHQLVAEDLQRTGHVSGAADHMELAALAALDLDPNDRGVPDRAADLHPVPAAVTLRR